MLNRGAPGTKFIPTVYFQWNLAVPNDALPSASEALNPALSTFLILNQSLPQLHQLYSRKNRKIGPMSYRAISIQRNHLDERTHMK
jgi:hypothetical protein